MQTKLPLLKYVIATTVTVNILLFCLVFVNSHLSIASSKSLNISNVRLKDSNQQGRVNLFFKTKKSSRYMVLDVNKKLVAEGKTKTGKVKINNLAMETKSAVIRCYSNNLKAEKIINLPSDHPLLSNSVIKYQIGFKRPINQYSSNNQKLFSISMQSLKELKTTNGYNIALKMRITNINYDLYNLQDDNNFRFVSAASPLSKLHLQSAPGYLKKGQTKVFTYIAHVSQAVDVKSVSVVFDNGNLDTPWNFFTTPQKFTSFE